MNPQFSPFRLNSMPFSYCCVSDENLLFCSHRVLSKFEDLQGSQPGSMKNPDSRRHDVIKKHFYVLQYRSAMNSWELPYYYHTFLVFQHKKLTFSLFWGYLETNCLLMASFYQGKWVKTSKIWTKRQKSEWVNENPYAKWNPSFHPYTSSKSKQ